MGGRSWTLVRGDYPAAAAARREFRAFLLGFAGERSDHEAAELIFGELVANAVTHARNQAVVEAWFDDWAYVRVSDDGTGFTVKPVAPVAVLAECGRGLNIVRELARDVRVESSAAGCTITAVLPVRAQAADGTRIRA